MSQFDQLENLARSIELRKHENAAASYTARLLSQGIEKCAQKLGEESIELVIASVQNDKKSITSEAADVFYHLLVLLSATGVAPEEVMAELRRREGTSGLAEKAARNHA